jgi:hypothetical protein
LKILAYKPTPSGGGNVIALVDAEVASGIRLHGLRLMRMPDGSHRVFGDRVGLDRAVVDAIASAAISLGGDRLESRSN